ncbi:hypothetical protein LTR78_001738 [Recurvomyces mirabilis]|uniref:Uncharacterized protein n=1 Tax=Recurvomyces mirabilis TaxID=574656 RepID=A0AAE1C575_9PEZI|nr:hypothetical protein LTR78_001738 [Recurvomyces mirabilis]
MPPASTLEHDSPLSALQREAEMDLDSEVEDLLDAGTRTDSGTKMRAWRRNVDQRAIESSEEAEDGNDDDDDDNESDVAGPGGDDDPATPRSAGPTHEQMMQIFPSIKQAASTTYGMQDLEPEIARRPSKLKHNRYQTHQLRHLSSTKSQSTTLLSLSTMMGLFALLPGELRNTIYRLAFVPPPSHQPVQITGSDLICGLGACVHSKASVAAPGMASTCKKVREELMPIYCAENEFGFDAVMVRNRCVGAWLKGLGGYAGLVRRVGVDVLVLERRGGVGGGGGGMVGRMGRIRVECPIARGDGRFEVGFSEIIPREKLEASELEGDELAELVFRCKK